MRMLNKCVLIRRTRINTKVYVDLLSLLEDPFFCALMVWQKTITRYWSFRYCAELENYCRVLLPFSLLFSILFAPYPIYVLLCISFHVSSNQCLNPSDLDGIWIIMMKDERRCRANWLTVEWWLKCLHAECQPIHYIPLRSVLFFFLLIFWFCFVHFPLIFDLLLFSSDV